MNDLLANLPKGEQKKLKETDQPDWIGPMLATLTHDRSSDKAWIFERKLDGERCLAFRSGKMLRLMSRNKRELNDTYPELWPRAPGGCMWSCRWMEIVILTVSAILPSRLQGYWRPGIRNG